ncbi:MAG: trypsin-like peptidase domain-containing protein [Geobacteraceae bacterium]|nr:trypsin-like peptidase domain-containing protein [Geobacteraceae bacterium]
MKNVKLPFLLLGMILCVALSAHTATCKDEEETPLQKMLLRLKPAVVLVFSNIQAQVTIQVNGSRKTFNADPMGGAGTGFLISSDGYLVTNGHVVADYHESNEKRLEEQFFISVLLKNLVPQSDKSGRQLTDQEKQQILIQLYKQLRPVSTIVIKKDLHVLLSNGDAYPAEIKQYSPPISPMTGKVSIPGAEQKVETGKDVAILKIEGRDLPTVAFGDSGSVQLGEPVYVIGYPAVVLSHDYLSKKTQLDSTVTRGNVSGSKLDVKGTPVIQTDASLTWGNSGGPAFNSKGEVIGIATFISLSQTLGSTQAIQGFNFLVPGNTAKEFVRASGVDMNTPSLFNKLWDEAIELYSIPDYQKALSKIDEVNRLMPNQPDVRKLQLAAQEKLSTQKGSWPILPIIIALAGALIVGGIVFFALHSRTKKPEIPSAPQPQAKTAMPSGSLRCDEGPLAGRSFTIGASGVKIGRDPAKNQVIIENDGVSREHAWVGMENGLLVIKDLNSLNGTYLNSSDSDRIKTEPVKDGDVIIIGKGRFSAFTYRAS